MATDFNCSLPFLCVVDVIMLCRKGYRNKLRSNHFCDDYERWINAFTFYRFLSLRVMQPDMTGCISVMSLEVENNIIISYAGTFAYDRCRVSIQLVTPPSNPDEPEGPLFSDGQDTAIRQLPKATEDKYTSDVTTRQQEYVLMLSR